MAALFDWLYIWVVQNQSLMLMPGFPCGVCPLRIRIRNDPVVCALPGSDGQIFHHRSTSKRADELVVDCLFV